MTATQCTVAKLQALVKNLPELIHVTICRKRNIRQVNGYDTLVKAAVILWFAGLIILSTSNVAISIA